MIKRFFFEKEGIFFVEKIKITKPPNIKLKNNGMALLSAYSFSKRKGYHQVPHKIVERIIAKFGFKFFNIIYCCTIKVIFGKTNL